ncbi:MAG: plasmid stabilization protein [Acidimicrobiaceae bacterium]|nr:plasmid stabilization protein [Acidimicrobiaceae bacterium]
MAKPVRLRQLAAADLDDASEYYRREAGEQTALDFVDAVERGIKRLRRNPQVGSLRFAYELAIPDLRAWPLERFPDVVFYVITDEEIDVWRVLHTRRDVPATIESPEA